MLIRKLLWFFIAALLLMLCLILTPLHYLQPLINSVLIPYNLKVQTLDGKIWHGRADITSSNIQNNIICQWSFNIFITPVFFQIKHDDLFILGTVEANIDNIIINLDELKIGTNVVNTALEKYQIDMVGDDIVVDKLYLQWPYFSTLPVKVKGNGVWNGGLINYSLEGDERIAGFDRVLFELDTRESDRREPEPYISLRTEKGVFYLEAQLKQDGEGVVTIMPLLLQALGMPWISRSNTAPAFVMTKRLFN